MTKIPTDTCPLCRRRELRWEGETCVCRSCGSAFVVDPDTRRCRYTRVAPEYAAQAPALTQRWLTRREVFERAGQAVALPTEQDELASRLAPASGMARPAAPITAVWAALIGVVALISILCACLSVFLLRNDIPRTREMIAAANLPTMAISPTVAAQITATEGVTNKISPLDSPLYTPEPRPTTMSEMMTGTIAPGALPTPVTLVVATAQKTDASATPGLSFLTPMPAGNDQPNVATATFPPTFTPLPVSILTDTPIPQNTPTPTSTPISGTVTATSTPTPTSSTTFTSAVRITMVMYTGTASLNLSDQYVEVSNMSNIPVNVSNWTINAASSARLFFFPNGLVIQAGQTCHIYGNSPPASSGGCGPFSFNSPTPVWSTSGDTARLYDQNGTLMYTYSYPAK